MSRHINPKAFYNLPSGNRVHPCRLIQKDGTLMWKHALLSQNELIGIPTVQPHEAHTLTTDQRPEEFNYWVPQDLYTCECLNPASW